MREMKVQVVAFYLTTVSFQQGRERSQLDGRVDMKPEGHIDQCDFQRHSTIVSITRCWSIIKIRLGITMIAWSDFYVPVVGSWKMVFVAELVCRLRRRWIKRDKTVPGFFAYWESMRKGATNLRSYCAWTDLKSLSNTLTEVFLRPFLIYKEGELICWSDLLVRALTEIIFFNFPELS